MGKKRRRRKKRWYPRRPPNKPKKVEQQPETELRRKGDGLGQHNALCSPNPAQPVDGFLPCASDVVKVAAHPPCEALWHRYNGTCQRDPKTADCQWCQHGSKEAFRE